MQFKCKKLLLKVKREDATLLSDQMTIKLFKKSYTHVTLMSPSIHLIPSQYLHLVPPSLTLGPASGDEGEFVALPLFIQPPVPVMWLLMYQTAFP